MRFVFRSLTLVAGAWLVANAAGTPGAQRLQSLAGALLLVAHVLLVELRLARLIAQERALDRLVRELQRGPE